MEHILTANLRAVADEFCRVTGLSIGTVARRMLGSDRFFSSVGQGATFTVRRYDEGLRRFSKAWPDGAIWPYGVDRPEDIGEPDAIEAVCENSGCHHAP